TGRRTHAVRGSVDRGMQEMRPGQSRQGDETCSERSRLMTTSGRVAAVTGAASGIGRATAVALARQGARVALCDPDARGLAAAADALGREGGQARVVELDVSDAAAAGTAIDDIAASWGRLDVLVNAAGISSAGASSRGPVLGITEADWDRILDVNLLGTVY